MDTQQKNPNQNPGNPQQGGQGGKQPGGGTKRPDPNRQGTDQGVGREKQNQGGQQGDGSQGSDR